MKKAVAKLVIRVRFALTSRQAVRVQTKRLLKEYLQLSQGMDELEGSKPAKVKDMLGVDEDMREWSFFEILRHNTIVNQEISGVVGRLAAREPEPLRKFDIKEDVMPGPDCGVEQISMFKSSVLDHLGRVEKLGPLKGTEETNHPLFGSFDAHKWNCLFAFHLEIHLKQAAEVRNAVSGVWE